MNFLIIQSSPVSLLGPDIFLSTPFSNTLNYDEVLSGYQLSQMVFFTAQPFDPADSLRELHHTHSPGKQQISLPSVIFFL
jgi:hypothetical protein